MIKQLLNVRGKWDVLIWYWVTEEDYWEVYNTLIQFGCPVPEAEYSADVVSSSQNTGLTFSDTDSRVSFVCVSSTTSYSQFVDTTMHEIKHVQSHICEYYDVDENSEDAAYLVGYLARRVYKFLQRII